MTSPTAGGGGMRRTKTTPGGNIVLGAFGTVDFWGK